MGEFTQIGLSKDFLPGFQEPYMISGRIALVWKLFENTCEPKLSHGQLTLQLLHTTSRVCRGVRPVWA